MSVEAVDNKPGGKELPPDWRTMPHGIRVGRYTDPGFLRLEYDKLWSKVWQVACRVDAIPEPGDFTVYEIGERSVIIVRDTDGAIKAHHNFCPHRGTALADKVYAVFPGAGRRIHVDRNHRPSRGQPAASDRRLWPECRRAPV